MSIHSAFGLYQVFVRPFADNVQQAIEVLTISCQVLLFICFANMMDPSGGAVIAEKCALGPFPACMTLTLACKTVVAIQTKKSSCGNISDSTVPSRLHALWSPSDDDQ